MTAKANTISQPTDPARAARAEDIPPELLARLQHGDPAALGDLFDLTGDRVYNTCRRITGHDSDAEDATQEVFLRVLDKARTFDGRSRFLTWLYRLTINHTLNLQHKSKRRRASGGEEFRAEELPPDPRPQPLETVAHREERQHLDEALQSLPADQRSIVILREIEELTYAEIAAILELPEGTVTSRLVRGRQRLGEMLQRRLQKTNHTQTNP